MANTIAMPNKKKDNTTKFDTMLIMEPIKLTKNRKIKKCLATHIIKF